ncbi:hypothetical protein [Rudanella lutea]|uniref:hypothetical protein n=1 Tax=Rudanella lutea TaxID=451374 RepID=UPI00035D0D20|nr:hypothetical protein [Rudanella lutea]
MNRYVIDHSANHHARPPAGSPPNRRVRVALPWWVLLVCCFGCAMSLAGWVHSNRANRQLQQAHDFLRVRYDSLLASQLETERQHLQFRQLLDSLNNRATAPSQPAQP